MSLISKSISNFQLPELILALDVSSNNIKKSALLTVELKNYKKNSVDFPSVSLSKVKSCEYPLTSFNTLL